MNNQWKMVPVIATEEMIRFASVAVPKTPNAQWNAMLAAAPVPPAGDVEVTLMDLTIEAAHHCGWGLDQLRSTMRLAGLPEASDEDLNSLLRNYANTQFAKDTQPTTQNVYFDKLAHEQVLAICRGAAASCNEQHTYMQGAQTDSKNWFPHQWVIDAIRNVIGINVSTCQNLRSDVTRLTAELTKARELLTDMLKDDDMPAHWFAQRINEILDNQSAPAAKGDSYE